MKNGILNILAILCLVISTVYRLQSYAESQYYPSAPKTQNFRSVKTYADTSGGIHLQSPSDEVLKNFMGFDLGTKCETFSIRDYHDDGTMHKKLCEDLYSTLDYDLYSYENDTEAKNDLQAIRVKLGLASSGNGYQNCKKITDKLYERIEDAVDADGNVSNLFLHEYEVNQLDMCRYYCKGVWDSPISQEICGINYGINASGSHPYKENNTDTYDSCYTEAYNDTEVKIVTDMTSCNSKCSEIFGNVSNTSYTPTYLYDKSTHALYPYEVDSLSGYAPPPDSQKLIESYASNNSNNNYFISSCQSKCSGCSNFECMNNILNYCTVDYADNALIPTYASIDYDKVLSKSFKDYDPLAASEKEKYNKKKSKALLKREKEKNSFIEENCFEPLGVSEEDSSVKRNSYCVYISSIWGRKDNISPEVQQVIQTVASSNLEHDIYAGYCADVWANDGVLPSKHCCSPKNIGFLYLYNSDWFSDGGVLNQDVPNNIYDYCVGVFGLSGEVDSFYNK